MKLKKLFIIEFVVGVMYSIFLLISYFFFPGLAGNSIVFNLIYLFFLLYSSAIGQGNKLLSGIEKVLFIKAVKIGACISLLFLFFCLMNIKNINHANAAYIFSTVVAIFFLLRSSSGLILLKRQRTPEDIISIADSADQQDDPPAKFLIINRTLFSSILIGGIIILVIELLFLKQGSNAVETLAIPACLIGYIVFTFFTRHIFSKKTVLDEREKYLIFKITSFASFLFLIFCLVLFAIKDYVLFSYLINAMWGLLLVPLFMVLWGSLGLIVLARE